LTENKIVVLRSEMSLMIGLNDDERNTLIYDLTGGLYCCIHRREDEDMQHQATLYVRRHQTRYVVLSVSLIHFAFRTER